MCFKAGRVFLYHMKYEPEMLPALTYIIVQREVLEEIGGNKISSGGRIFCLCFSIASKLSEELEEDLKFLVRATGG